MKKIGVGLVVVLTLASASAAQAEDLRHHRIFGDANVGSVDSASLAETAAVEKACSFNVMSRRGPDPEDLAACEAAASRLEKRGIAAAPAIFAALDKEKVSYYAKRRLYDALARTRDTRLVEPLIAGMARIASRRVGAREFEGEMIHQTLGELSRAQVGERAPWVKTARRSDHEEAISQAIDWRLWHEEHRGVAHEKLAADRLADARAHAADKDAERAFGAVRYLLEHQPKEGLEAARVLGERRDLPREGRDNLNYHMREAIEAANAAAHAADPTPAPAAEPKPVVVPAKAAPAKSKPQVQAPKAPGKVGS